MNLSETCGLERLSSSLVHGEDRRDFSPRASMAIEAMRPDESPSTVCVDDIVAILCRPYVSSWNPAQWESGRPQQYPYPSCSLSELPAGCTESVEENERFSQAPPEGVTNHTWTRGNTLIASILSWPTNLSSIHEEGVAAISRRR